MNLEHKVAEYVDAADPTHGALVTALQSRLTDDEEILFIQPIQPERYALADKAKAALTRRMSGSSTLVVTDLRLFIVNPRLAGDPQVFDIAMRSVDSATGSVPSGRLGNKTGSLRVSLSDSVRQFVGISPAENAEKIASVINRARLS